jgi:hypothetical protein
MGDEIGFSLDSGGNTVRVGASGTLVRTLFPAWHGIAVALAQTADERRVVDWLAGHRGAGGTSFVCLDRLDVFQQPEALAFFAKVLEYQARSLDGDDWPRFHVMVLHALVRDRLADRAALPALDIDLDENTRARWDEYVARTHLGWCLGERRSVPAPSVLAGFDELIAVLDRSRSPSSDDQVSVLLRRALWCRQAGLLDEERLTYGRLFAIDEDPEGRAVWSEMMRQGLGDE